MAKRMSGVQTTKNNPAEKRAKKAPAKKAPAKKAPAKKNHKVTAKTVRQDGTVVLSNGEKTTCAIGRYGKPVVKPGDGFVKINGVWELVK